MAYKWAGWIYNPCRLGGPRCFTVGDKIRSGPQVGQWLHNPCRLGVPDASGRGTKSEVAHKWPEKSETYFFFFEVLKPSKKTFYFYWVLRHNKPKNFFLLGSRYLVKTSGPSKL